ncbi:hypothetical protein GW17_00036820 [Ensete ventricosum]|nr:hypothetical protein GW17_00036820 [Ensete ventricosum]
MREVGGAVTGWSHRGGGLDPIRHMLCVRPVGSGFDLGGVREPAPYSSSSSSRRRRRRRRRSVYDMGCVLFICFTVMWTPRRSHGWVATATPE